MEEKSVRLGASLLGLKKPGRSTDDQEILIENDEISNSAQPSSSSSVQEPPKTANQGRGLRPGTQSLAVPQTRLEMPTILTPTRSTTDLPNQLGNTINSAESSGPGRGGADPGGTAIGEDVHDRELHEGACRQTRQQPDGAPVDPTSEHVEGTFSTHVEVDGGLQRNQQWATNYKEAAIFLEEGENNVKFCNHPRSKEELPAYLLVHTKWFNRLDFLAAMVLLLLGFFEEPTTDRLTVPPQIHAITELCTLSLITVLTMLRTRWIGCRSFFRHQRTLIKVITLSIMIVDAVVVIGMARSHFRIVRCLRPIFLIDNHYCGGIRRFVRQIFQSLAPILDMLFLVFFTMLIYSVFGFYLFREIDKQNFDTFLRSFISLFILLTTANDPDVMMASYNYNRVSAIFFISYLSINLYFLMNLMLAVVYDVFTRKEREKFKALFLHKRKAAQYGFGLLVTRDRRDRVSFEHFEGMMTHFRPRKTPAEVYLIFKHMNKTGSGYLDVNEFYGIYDACQYSWKVYKREDEAWFSRMQEPARSVLKVIHSLVTHRFFNYGVYFVVLVNGVILVVETALVSHASNTAINTNIYAYFSYTFIGLYTVEASLKLVGLGISKYFRSKWNCFDFVVTVLGIVAIIMEALSFHHTFYYIIVLRPLRLLTLFRMKKRFRDVFGTTVILMPRLFSAVVVLLLLYYFFAIIGMECFHGLKLINCCVNTSVEQFYKYYGPGAPENAYYWLNNFNDMPTAGVTLFELTVVNNWFIIMEGHASVTDDWSRIFFMTFYIVTMIVMTIIVAFILEAFLFRIQYKEFCSKEQEKKNLSTEVKLSGAEIHNMILHSNLTRDIASIAHIRPNATYSYFGLKRRTKEQLQILMYNKEIQDWIQDFHNEEQKTEARRQAVLVEEQRRQGEEEAAIGIRRRWSLRRRRNSSMANNRGEGSHCDESNSSVQVVEDGENATVIRRSVIPDSTLQGRQRTPSADNQV